MWKSRGNEHEDSQPLQWSTFIWPLVCLWTTRTKYNRVWCNQKAMRNNIVFYVYAINSTETSYNIYLIFHWRFKSFVFIIIIMIFHCNVQCRGITQQQLAVLLYTQFHKWKYFIWPVLMVINVAVVCIRIVHRIKPEQKMCLYDFHITQNTQKNPTSKRTFNGYSADGKRVASLSSNRLHLLMCFACMRYLVE